MTCRDIHLIGQLGPLMGYCDHQMRRQMAKMLRQYDVSPMQCRTLTFLHEAECEVNQRMLEKHLMVKPSTASGIVGRLEEKGLLRQAMGDLLPRQIAHRKKSPYPKTVHPAYLRLVSMGLERLLDEDASPLFAFVRREALEELLSCNSAQPWYGQLMTVPQTIAYFLQMDHWLRTYQVRLV